MKKLFLQGSRKGITLIEVIVVMAIIGILLISIGQIFITNTQLTIKTNDRIQAKDEVLIIQDFIFDRVKYSSHINITSIAAPTIGDVQSIFVDSRGLIHRTNSGDRVIFSQQALGRHTINLHFSSTTASNKSTIISVTAGQMNGGTIKPIYKGNTSVKCINMTTASVPSTSGSVIEFVIP